MFDIDRELNEIRNINAAPSKELIKSTRRMVENRYAQIKAERAKMRKSNIIKFTVLSALPAAAILFAVVLSMALPKTTARYSLDFGESMEMSVDENGIVTNVEFEDGSWENIDDELEGVSVESAMSLALNSAYESEKLDAMEDVLIGCFGDDEYNNISKNQILLSLNENLANGINLMSIHGTTDDWKYAKKINVSPGIYALSLLSDKVNADKYTALNSLIYDIEMLEEVDIAVLVSRAAEDIVYFAPAVEFKLDKDNVVLSWDYIDFKSGNYDGYLTYQAVASQNPITGQGDYDGLDEYTFASWDKQPTSFTFDAGLLKNYSYFAVAVLYDDGTWVISDETAYVY